MGERCILRPMDRGIVCMLLGSLLIAGVPADGGTLIVDRDAFVHFESGQLGMDVGVVSLDETGSSDSSDWRSVSSRRPLEVMSWDGDWRSTGSFSTRVHVEATWDSRASSPGGGASMGIEEWGDWRERAPRVRSSDAA